MFKWLFGPKKTWTKAEVEAQVKAVKPGLDPSKLARIVKLLMGILSAILPIFMALDPQDPEAHAMLDSINA